MSSQLPVPRRAQSRMAPRWVGPLLATLLAAGFLPACAESRPSDALGAKPAAPFTRLGAALSVGTSYVTEQAAADAFAVFANGTFAPLVVASDDYPGVHHAAENLQGDIKAVGGTEPQLIAELPQGAGAVIIGTVGHSSLIDGLVSAGKLDVTDLDGRWEKFVTTIVDAPAAGLDHALVIAGSDKRGTIYGMYDLAERMGVSPWGDFADVPAQSHAQIYVLPGRHTLGEPAVKYRGFFINDENPALLDWYAETYGGNGRFKAEFYTRVFDLLLRMKANYMWPAMWGKSFNDDDPNNPKLADEYGIVMGTSHHEPMTRSQQEWADHGSGDWRYDTNEAALKTFWTDGIERMADRESLVTIGMRGDGDVSLTGATQTLMEKIVVDQRNIIQTVTGKQPSEVPQMWALYKEVQGFYDDGLEAPDDVTLLMCDDNWGNIRRLPKTDTAPRAGGFGVYYHFDYVGGPRSYKWVNTNPLPRVWEQMRLAHQLGANQVWIVNVGDIKPMEFPIQFFLDYAWNPDSFTTADLYRYPQRWAATQFGPEHAEAIGRILAGYAKFNGRRKPELLAPETYSLGAFHEWETVVSDFNALAQEAETINAALDAKYKDAFYQLVLYPVAASANLNEMYYAVAKNRLYAQQQRTSTNQWATKASQLFANDTTLVNNYHGVAGGKWKHMMKQTHIGYTDWEEPATNTMPSTQQYQANGAASMGVAIEGSTTAWPGGSGTATLPELMVYYPAETRFVELFNKGTGSFEFTATADSEAVTVTPASGTVTDESRLSLSVDWSKVAAGKTQVNVTLAGGGGNVQVVLPLNKPETPTPEAAMGFVESNGYISIDPAAFSAELKTDQARLEVIPDLGRTGNAVSITPANAAPIASPGGTSPHLEYPVHLFTTGQIKVRVYLSPTLPVHSQGLKYAVSFDDAAPQVLDMHTGLPQDFTENTTQWQQWVSDNIITQVSNHTITTAGAHTLKLWMVDPGVVVQKLVVETGTIPTSYLGPPTVAPLGYVVAEPAPPEPSVVLPPAGSDSPVASGTAPQGTSSVPSEGSALPSGVVPPASAAGSSGGPLPTSTSPAPTDSNGLPLPPTTGTSTGGSGTSAIPAASGSAASPSASVSSAVGDAPMGTATSGPCSVTGHRGSAPWSALWALAAASAWRLRLRRKAAVRN